MKTHITELVPSNSRKSFYGRARVIEIAGAHCLRSYDTVVGCVDKDGVTHRYSDWDSKTTRCHVKSFCEQFSDIDSKAFWKLPCEKHPALKVTL